MIHFALPFVLVMIMNNYRERLLYEDLVVLKNSRFRFLFLTSVFKEFKSLCVLVNAITFASHLANNFAVARPMPKIG